VKGFFLPLLTQSGHWRQQRTPANLAVKTRKSTMSEPVSNSLPVVLVPGLTCTARLYADQIPALWQFGPVTVADHRRDDSMANIAGRILTTAPPHFALVGLSMGGFIAFEIMRQAPERVPKLALLDTSSRPDAPEQTERRRLLMGLAKEGRYAEIPEHVFPIYVHRNRHGDEALKRIVREMAEQLTSRPTCASNGRS
jgi:pimeloyl-ACP methyl ester carboxylesterase